MCWMHEAQRRSGARREAGKIGRDKRTHDRAGHIGRGKCPEIGDTRSTVPRSTHETIKLRGLCAWWRHPTQYSGGYMGFTLSKFINTATDFGSRNHPDTVVGITVVIWHVQMTNSARKATLTEYTWLCAHQNKFWIMSMNTLLRLWENKSAALQIVNKRR